MSNMNASTAKLPGYVYILGFESGLVKVGKTKYPERRLTEHRNTLGKMSSIKHEWLSQPHFNETENEFKLIDYLGANGSEIGIASFHQVVDFAAALPLITDIPSYDKDDGFQELDYLIDLFKLAESVDPDAPCVRMADILMMCVASNYEKHLHAKAIKYWREGTGT